MNIDGFCISGIFKLRKEFQLCVYLEKTSCPLSGKLHFFLTFIEQALSTPVRLNQVFLPQVVLLLATIQSCSRDTYYFLICFKKRLSSSKLHSTEIGGFCQSFCPSLFGVCASITYLTLLLMNALALVYVHFWILDSYLDQSPAFLTSNDFTSVLMKSLEQNGRLWTNWPFCFNYIIRT